MASIVLYRAVSRQEFAQLRRTQRFEITTFSVEGKYFAETIDDAVAWGKRLFTETTFYVVGITFQMTDADQFFRWERLDGIGAARFVASEQLATTEYVIEEVVL